MTTQAKPIKFLGLTLPHRNTSYATDGSTRQTYYAADGGDDDDFTVVVCEGENGCFGCGVFLFVRDHYVELIEVSGHPTVAAAKAEAASVCRAVFKVLAHADGYEVTS